MVVLTTELFSLSKRGEIKSAVLADEEINGKTFYTVLVETTDGKILEWEAPSWKAGETLVKHLEKNIQ